MPFGCVAYEAMLLKKIHLSLLHVSPMPFGCVAYEALKLSQSIN